MKTFKVTVMQLTRIEVKILAENERDARSGWNNGLLLSSNSVSVDILDTQEVQ